jgi:PTS system cellobiose-specific IIB component
MLAAKVVKVAKDKGVELNLRLTSAAGAAIYNFGEHPVDLVLVAPQMRLHRRSVEKKAGTYGIPVEMIDTVTFGMVDGEKLFEQIVRVMQTKRR